MSGKRWRDQLAVLEVDGKECPPCIACKRPVLFCQAASPFDPQRAADIAMSLSSVEEVSRLAA